MEAESGYCGKLGLPSDKENCACEQGPRQVESWKENGLGATLGVNTERPPAEGPSQSAAEPLSPSKRFNTCGASFQPACQPEGPASDGNSDNCRVDAKQQICFDYTKGVCKRGTTCKYSHDVEEIVRVNSQERGVCFDFLRNSCQRGLLCRFSHDLSSIVVQDQGQKAGRKNAPICYDFVKGVCKREDCRYSHDIFSIIRGKNEGTGPEICYDFTRGKCNRGSACRYSHDLQHAEGLAGLSTDAVAALAAQHAQLAAATAVAMEASRRQSAPGCLQAGQDPLLNWLGNLHSPLTAGLGDTAAATQAALALQLQSQWVMQLQAQAAAQVLQSQAAGAPGFEALSQAAAPIWPANLPAALLSQRAGTPMPAQVQLPPAPPPPTAGLQDLRRHTHDGSATSGLPPEAIMQHLQQLNLCHTALQADPVKMTMDLPRHAPSDSLSGNSTIGANWQSGRSTPMPSHATSLASKQQMQLHRSLSLSQPFPNPGAEQRRVLEAERSASYRLPEAANGTAATLIDSQAGIATPLLSAPARVAYNLRTFPSNPVTRMEQDSLAAASSLPREPAWQSSVQPGLVRNPSRLNPLPRPNDPSLQAAQGVAEPLHSISFEDRPQAVARDQLAFFQEIWRQ